MQATVETRSFAIFILHAYALCVAPIAASYSCTEARRKQAAVASALGSRLLPAILIASLCS